MNEVHFQYLVTQQHYNILKEKKKETGINKKKLNKPEKLKTELKIKIYTHRTVRIYTIR